MGYFPVRYNSRVAIYKHKCLLDWPLTHDQLELGLLRYAVVCINKMLYLDRAHKKSDKRQLQCDQMFE